LGEEYGLDFLNKAMVSRMCQLEPTVNGYSSVAAVRDLQNLVLIEKNRRVDRYYPAVSMKKD